MHSADLWPRFTVCRLLSNEREERASWVLGAIDPSDTQKMTLRPEAFSSTLQRADDDDIVQETASPSLNPPHSLLLSKSASPT